MDTERLLGDIKELMALADRIATKRARRGVGASRYGSLRKTPHYDLGALAKGTDDGDAEDESGDGWGAHAQIKSAHHAQLADLYQTIADQHSSMARHYAGGDDEVDDEEHNFEKGEKFVDSFTIPKEWWGDAREDGGVAQRLQQGVEQRLQEAAEQRAAVGKCLRRPLIGVPRASR